MIPERTQIWENKMFTVHINHLFIKYKYFLAYDHEKWRNSL